MSIFYELPKNHFCVPRDPPPRPAHHAKGFQAAGFAAPLSSANASSPPHYHPPIHHPTLDIPEPPAFVPLEASTRTGGSDIERRLKRLRRDSIYSFHAGARVFAKKFFSARLPLAQKDYSPRSSFSLSATAGSMACCAELELSPAGSSPRISARICSKRE